MRDEQPAPIMECRDFPGLQLETDARDLPPGAAHIQTNWESSDVGNLKTTLRYLPVEFD